MIPIRFKVTITEPADGDHPEFLLARRGDTGKIVDQELDANGRCSVKVDWWPDSFRARPHEFEVL